MLNHRFKGTEYRLARDGAGRSVTSVATQVGKTPKYLREIERGERQPSTELAGALARAINVDLSDLIEIRRTNARKVAS